MNKENKDQTNRPPVIVVMGHIDHGKSTLLDYIRRTNTTDKEAGGITQHISAYEAECDVGGEKRKFTFLDTPGHEAFCLVRARGASVADIAILVVSSEDGVKPQTVEAIKCINKEAIPLVVAINKIDRPGANIEKTKQSLAENEIFVEGWGGTVPVANISAKTGEGVDELIELLALQSDMEDLKGDPKISAEGFVIESGLDKRQGIYATLIIKNGSIKTGMFIASEGTFAPIRAIENYKRENISEASFSSPIRITGWSTQPKVGNAFKTFKTKEEAVKFSEENIGQSRANEENFPEGCAFLDIVVKADTCGSLDAIGHELKKLNSEKISAKMVLKGIGTISENDIKTASIEKRPVIGFNVGVDKIAEALAMRNNIEIKTFRIIYELVDYIKEKMKEATPTETVEVVTGSAKVLKVFSKNKDKQIVGCRAEEGEIKTNANVQIYRRDSQIGSGKIKELQIQKIKTDIIKSGEEFGAMIESKIELAPGDIVKVTSLIKK